MIFWTPPFYRKDDGTLQITLFCKENDSHSYLLHSSSHPDSVKSGLPYSEFLRVRRIFSETEEFEKNAAMIAAHFLRRGYPLEIIDIEFARASTLT